MSFFVIIVFAFFGQRSCATCTSRCPALQGAGGLLLLLVALELLTGNEKEPTAAPGRQRRAGAARDAAAGRAGRDRRDDAVRAAVDDVGRRSPRSRSASCWCTSCSGWRCGSRCGSCEVIRESGVLLVTRIAGLLLSAIAVQMVADSVRAFIAGEG